MPDDYGQCFELTATIYCRYYWAFRLGGPTYGPFASWTAGWCNLLGQIAGVASGGFSGAQIIGNIISVTSGYDITSGQTIALYLVVLIVAGIVNTYAETLLTSLCYISVAWHIVGTLIIVIWMLSSSPTRSLDFIFTSYENDTGFPSTDYVVFIGVLAAASTFTGYDTAAHVAEETTNSHNSTPLAMMGSILNALILGLVLIIGMNACIQDLDSLVNSTNGEDSYTILWKQTVGKGGAVFFLIIVLVAIECSNCANLTSASRMVYSFSRDGALPFSSYFYSMDEKFECPLRAIWLCVIIAFLIGLPGLGNQAVLGALFSLTATGLYSSYMIPILLRITVSRNTFQPAEFNLGRWSTPIGVFSVFWCIAMTVILCLPEETPINGSTLNYSPIALGGILLFAWTWWIVSARFWFKGATLIDLTKDEVNLSEDFTNGDEVQEKFLRMSLFSEINGVTDSSSAKAERASDTSRRSSRISWITYRGSDRSNVDRMSVTNPISSINGDNWNNGPDL